MNIERIITEAINKQLLIKENTLQTQFAQLEYCANELNRYRKSIRNKNLSSIQNKNIYNFITHEFYKFSKTLEFSIRKCVKSMNINEISMYQLGLPNLNLFNGVGYAMRNGYWSTYNFLNGLRGGDTINRKQTTNMNQINVNENAKLLDLLYNTYPQIKNKYKILNKNYEISKLVVEIDNSINLIDKNLIPIVKKIKANS